MGLPGWALLALVGVPLAQIPLVLYLSRWFELDGEAPAPVPGRGYWTAEVERGGATRVATPTPGRCGRCGAENDPGYTFCWNCTGRL